MERTIHMRHHETHRGTPRAWLLATSIAGWTGCIPDHPNRGTDQDGDGWYATPEGIAAGGFDCDDGDPTAHPGHPEVCDDLEADNDCDGVPDGDALPFIDLMNDGLDDGWEIVIGTQDAITTSEDGLVVQQAPLAFIRAPGAECWTDYRLALRWVFEEDTPFQLDLGVFVGPDLEEGEPLQQDRYVLSWDYDHADSGSFELHRWVGGEPVLLNRATWQPKHNDYALSPTLIFEVRAEERYTELRLIGGREEVFVTRDRFDDRLHGGGAFIHLVEGGQAGNFVEVDIEPH